MEATVPTLLDRRRTLIAALSFAVLLIGLIGGGAYWLLRGRPDRSNDPVFIAQSLVSRQLADGFTPHFNPPEWTNVHQEGGAYVVSGWLQAVNREGELVNLNYSVEIIRSPSGWSARRVDLMPQ